MRGREEERVERRRGEPGMRGGEENREAAEHVGGSCGCLVLFLPLV